MFGCTHTEASLGLNRWVSTQRRFSCRLPLVLQLGRLLMLPDWRPIIHISSLPSMHSVRKHCTCEKTNSSSVYEHSLNMTPPLSPDPDVVFSYSVKGICCGVKSFIWICLTRFVTLRQQLQLSGLISSSCACT